MQLVRIIERFSTEELAELRSRWGYEHDEQASRRAIADAISQKQVLATAFVQLDAFQLQLFRWIKDRPGHEAKWSELLDAVGDRAPLTYLEQELADLRLWGLIDFHAAPQGFVGTYPAAVAAFPSTAVSLRDQLAVVGTDHLRQICSALGMKNPPKDKAGRLAAIVQTLLDPEAARAIVDALEPASRAILEWVRGKGGRVSLAEISAQPGCAYARQMSPLPSYSTYAPKGDVVSALTHRCLLLPVSDYPGYWVASAFVVPEEVERALAGGSYFEGVPVQPPPLETAEGATGAAPTPLHLIRDVGHLLGFVAAGRCEWRQDGAPYQRSLTAFGKAVRNPDKAYPSALWTICTNAGLLFVSDYRMGGYRAAENPTSDGPAEFGRFLLKAWALGGVEGLSPLMGGSGLAARRLSFVELLMTIPPDVWITRDSLLRYLAFKRSLLFAGRGDQPPAWPADWDTMRYLVFAEGSTPKGEPAIMMPSAASALLPAPGEAAEDTLPPWDDSWVIQPDRTIIVPPNASPGALRDLWTLANLEDNQGAAIFRITAESVAGALNRGMTPAEVEATLRRGSKTDLPNTVERLLQDQGKRYGQIKLGSAMTYVRSDDPALLEALMHDRRIGGLQWRLLAPGVAAVENAAPATVLQTLRKAGHLPVMEETAPAKGQAAPALAPMDSAAMRELKRILRAAIEDRDPLAVKWQQNGRSRSAEIVPFRLSGNRLDAYNPDTGAEYRIPLESLTAVDTLDDLDDLFEDEE